MQSGCAFNPWVLNENHRIAAIKLANNLGCLSNDSEKIVKYLRNVSAIDLMKGSKFKVCEYCVLMNFSQVLLPNLT